MAGVVRYEPSGFSPSVQALPADGVGKGLQQAAGDVSQAASQMQQTLLFMDRHGNAERQAAARANADRSSAFDRGAAEQGLAELEKRLRREDRLSEYQTEATRFLEGHVENGDRKYQEKFADPMGFAIYQNKTADWLAPMTASIPTKQAAFTTEIARGNLQRRMDTVTTDYALGHRDLLYDQYNDIRTELDTQVKEGTIQQADATKLMAQNVADVLEARRAFYQKEDPLNAQTYLDRDVEKLRPYLDAAAISKVYSASLAGKDRLSKEAGFQLSKVMQQTGAVGEKNVWLSMAESMGANPAEVGKEYDSIRSNNFLTIERELNHKDKVLKQASSEIRQNTQAKLAQFAFQPNKNAAAVSSMFENEYARVVDKLTPEDQTSLKEFGTSLAKSRDNIIEDRREVDLLRGMVELDPNSKSTERALLKANIKEETFKSLMNTLWSNRNEFRKEYKSRHHEEIQRATADFSRVISKGISADSEIAVEGKANFQKWAMDFLYRGDDPQATPEVKALWRNFQDNPSKVLKQKAEEFADEVERKTYIFGERIYKEMAKDNHAPKNSASLAAMVHAGMLETKSDQGRDRVNALYLYLGQREAIDNDLRRRQQELEGMEPKVSTTPQSQSSSQFTKKKK